MSVAVELSLRGFSLGGLLFPPDRDWRKEGSENLRDVNNRIVLFDPVFGLSVEFPSLSDDMSFITRAVGKSSFNALRVQRANYNFLAKAVAKPLGVQTSLKGTN